MELLIGDTIQYLDDDWSYIIRDIDTSKKCSQILYECISPNGGDNSMIWTHTTQNVLKSIGRGEITIIKRLVKPIKNFPNFKFTPKPNYR